MSEDTLIVEATPTWPASYNYSVVTGVYNGMPSPKERVRRAMAYQNGTMTAFLLEQCLKYPNKIQSLLCAAAYAEQRRVETGLALYQANYLNAPTYFNPNSQTELTNGAFGPIAALYHYAFGDGSSLSADLSKLNFNFYRENLKPVDTILKTINVGSFDINQNIGYDFRESSYWEWGYLGRVSLNLRGTLEVDTAGNWKFDGKVIGFSDRYDANKDVNRGKVGELLTDVLRAIPGLEYEIYFKGEHKIQLSGKR